MTNSDDGKNAETYPGDDIALLIGRIAVAWNSLQEHLGVIFGNLFDNTHSELALTAWHSLLSDRSQRDMLKAVARKKLGSAKAADEIVWLCDQADQKLAAQRNAGIHVPLMIYSETDGPRQTLPLTYYGNRHARTFNDRNFRAELEHYAVEIDRMAGYATWIMFNTSPVRVGPESWPDRPDVQRYAPTQNHKA